jgi:dTDP-4-dehydrorhamnose 3,5-epimerase
LTEIGVATATGYRSQRESKLIFVSTKIAGAFLIELERIEDPRGFFARTYCQKEFVAHGLEGNFVQCSLSFNTERGTLRGIHYQASPHEETKLVRCVQGALYDVLLDLRRDSPTYRQWMAFELTAENRSMLYIPAGVAHGYQTLVPASEVFYQMSAVYERTCSRSVRWDDPSFGIDWPIKNPILSETDRSHALWQ